jgi:adenylate kinase family enzyme
MKVIGITGGVGAGKSTVLGYIETHYKAKILYADTMAKELQQKGRPLYEPVLELLGRDVLGPDEEIDKAVKEAAEYEAQDKKRKEAIETKNEADAFCMQTEKALNEVGDKVSADEKATVEADIKSLREILDKYKDNNDLTDDQVAEIKSAHEKLQTSAQQVFTKMYEAAQAAQQAAGAQGADTSSASSSTNAEDDIIDADFKEV